MSTIGIAIVIILTAIAIDSVIRWVITPACDGHRFKSAGIITLLIMSVTHRQRRYDNKLVAIKQFFLSVAIVIFLLTAHYLLLSLGMPQWAHILQFGLMLAPLFVLPFFHFLYELLVIDPLSINSVLSNFHLRGILALILSANVIFFSMETTQNIPASVAHFILSYFSIFGLFNLCTLHRKKPSIFRLPEMSQTTYFEPFTLKYLAAILEFSYYLYLLYFFFFDHLIKSNTSIIVNEIYIGSISIAIVFITALIVKYQLYHHAPITLRFYEERILPLSFLLFGINTIVQAYF